jgi:hypothetical protein
MKDIWKEYGTKEEENKGTKGIKEMKKFIKDEDTKEIISR